MTETRLKNIWYGCMIDFQFLHMIPDLYFLNESNMFVAAAAAWSVFAGIMFRIWLNILYFVLILFCPPQQEEITGC